jgi:hypothetical protein
MAGRDPSPFDYLFDSGDAEADGVGDDAPVRDVAPPGRSWSSVAVVVAFVIGVGLGVVILWPRTADAVQTPTAVTTTAPAAPATTPSAVVPPPLPPPLPEATAIEEQAPPPVEAPKVQAPPTSAAPARKTPAPTPTVRAPISVSPAPRPAFPNQHPDPGSDGHGGLLGTGLL